MTVHCIDCRVGMSALPAGTFDAVVTDPPYEIGFLNKAWDASGIAYDVAMWRDVLRTMKPGAYLLAFSAPRTYHRIASAIESAGFEIRDQIMWLYGEGMPKAKNLKPAHEPIVLARKAPAGNALNIEVCRLDGPGGMRFEKPRGGFWKTNSDEKAKLVQNEKGRWPANVIHDGSDDVMGNFLNGEQRFYYCAKAMREPGNTHPTVKPLALMRYLCRLVTPAGGVVFDPFSGSGTTGVAAYAEGFQFLGFESNAEYAAIAQRRVVQC